MLIPLFLSLLVASIYADNGYCLCYCFDSGVKFFSSNQTTINCNDCTVQYCAALEKAGSLHCPSANLTRQTRCTPIGGVNWEGDYSAQTDSGTVGCSSNSCCCPTGGVSITHNKTGAQSHITFTCSSKAGAQEAYFTGAHTDKHYTIKYAGGTVELIYNDLNDIFFFENFGACKSELVAPKSKAGLVIGILFAIFVVVALGAAGFWYYKNRSGSGYTQL